MPVVPCVLNWLEVQKTKDWPTLCFDNSAASSFGRALVPFLASFITLEFSSLTCLFGFIAFLVGCAFLTLLILTRTVREVTRVIAVEKLSETLMATDEMKKRGSKKNGLLERVREDGYTKLQDGEDLQLEVIPSDQVSEDEL